MTLPTELPTGWAWARLDMIADVAGGIAKGRDLTGKQTLFVPYLRVANVQRGYLDLSEVKTIEILADEYDRYGLHPGDVLFTEGGDADKLGRSVVWRGEVAGCVHQNHVFRARLCTRVASPQWVSYWANSEHGRTYFQNAAKQTTNLASINISQLRGLPIALPPLAEQERIIQKTETLITRIETAEALLLSIHKKIRKYRNSVLKTALLGRLVPQDPNDVPASVLLERIREEREQQAPAPKRRTRKPGGAL